MQSLQRHAKLEAGNVKVSVTDNTVTLNGTVDTYFEKNLIANATWMAPGVTKVINNLSVAWLRSAAA